MLTNDVVSFEQQGPASSFALVFDRAGYFVAM